MTINFWSSFLYFIGPEQELFSLKNNQNEDFENCSTQILKHKTININIVLALTNCVPVFQFSTSFLQLFGTF